jgi:succinate dehydrogenase flavoprotein subunit
MSRLVIYGGGVAALAAALAAVRRGLAVDLVGPTHAARHPHLPEGGIAHGDDDALMQGLTRGGATEDDAKAIAAATADWVDELMTLGVPFVRDGSELSARRLEGWNEANACYVDGRTATQVAWALDAALERAVHDGAELRRLPEMDLLDVVCEDGRALGVIARQRVGGTIVGLPASAILLASPGRPGTLQGATAPLHPERTVAASYRAGAALAGSGRPLLHPTLLSHGQIPQPLSSALRAEGARFWVPADDKEARVPRDIPAGDRDYFVEERFGDDGRLRDDVSLAGLILEVTSERGIWDRKERHNRGTAYLDISHFPEGHLRSRVGHELDAIAARAPRSPFEGPFEIEVGAVSLGLGLAVDAAHRTSISGLFAAGPSAWRHHGEHAVGGTRLLTELHGARVAVAAIELAGDASDEGALEQARKAAEKLHLDHGHDPGASRSDTADELARLFDELARGSSDGQAFADAIGELADDDEPHRYTDVGIELGLAGAALLGGAPRVVRAADGQPTAAEIDA